MVFLGYIEHIKNFEYQSNFSLIIYRPISLLSTLSIIIESLVVRLLFFLLNSKLDSKQYSFRKNSTNGLAANSDNLRIQKLDPAWSDHCLLRSRTQKEQIRLDDDAHLSFQHSDPYYQDSNCIFKNILEAFVWVNFLKRLRFLFKSLLKTFYNLMFKDI